MAHKTFISYKYSEATGLRDAIIKKLGSNATYYQGETSSSPDMTDLKTSTIRQKLADMIYDTTVMIVVVSPNMTLSSWMEWEIKYALREQSRNGRTSHSDGVVCVMQKNTSWAEKSTTLDIVRAYTDPYSWAKNSSGQWLASKFFDVLVNNMIDIVTEDNFLKSPSHYIDRAFEKSENSGTYNITK